MQIKICGVTNPKDARWAAACGADFIGLIRASSPRQVSLDAARAIVAELATTAEAVLVYRDAPVDEVAREIAAAGVRWVQLHGDEPADYLATLRALRPALHIIKAGTVPDAAAAEAIRQYLQAARAAGGPPDVMLLDAPKRGPHPGYDVLGRVSRAVVDLAPAVWCAGNLTPENVVIALAAGRYAGADVSSGVERSPGLKDAEQVRAFVATVRSAKSA